MANIAGEFKEIIEADGLPAAMRWLNARVPYRFTGIFAFYGDILRNICLVDKDNANITHCPDQPIVNSYCIYIHRSRERFSVEDAMADGRVEGHPKRRSYHCYYGIPLLDSDGNLRGTVCHFDCTPVRVTDDVVAALDDLALIIAEAAFSASEPH
jgi:GAF domain-containing protein